MIIQFHFTGLLGLFIVSLWPWTKWDVLNVLGLPAQSGGSQGGQMQFDRTAKTSTVFLPFATYIWLMPCTSAIFCPSFGQATMMYLFDFRSCQMHIIIVLVQAMYWKCRLFLSVSWNFALSNSYKREGAALHRNQHAGNASRDSISHRFP